MTNLLNNTSSITSTMASTSAVTSWNHFFLKTLIAFFVVSNYKVLPFKWTLHFYYYVIKYLFVRPLFRKHQKIVKTIPDSSPATSNLNISNPTNTTTPITAVSETDRHLFYANAYYSRAVLMECDLNGHKSNSTYFSDLDLARTDLLIDIFDEAFMHYKKTKGRYPYVPLGSVSCVFKREIKPFQKYVIRSRVLGWDDKWLFVISRFEFEPPKGEPAKAGTKSNAKAFPSNESRGKLAAIGLSKYVFKLGRKTIPPEEFLSHAEARLGITQEDYKKGRMDFERAKGIVEAEANTVDLELFE